MKWNIAITLDWLVKWNIGITIFQQCSQLRAISLSYLKKKCNFPQCRVEEFCSKAFIKNSRSHCLWYHVQKHVVLLPLYSAPPILPLHKINKHENWDETRNPDLSLTQDFYSSGFRAKRNNKSLFFIIYLFLLFPFTSWPPKTQWQSPKNDK